MIQNFPYSKQQIINYLLKNMSVDVKKLFTSVYDDNDFYEMTNFDNFLKAFHYKDNNDYHNYKAITDTFTNGQTYKLYDCEIDNLNLSWSTNTNTDETVYIYKSIINNLKDTKKNLNLYCYNSYVENIICYNLKQFVPSEYLKTLRITEMMNEDYEYITLDLRNTQLESIFILSDYHPQYAQLNILLPNTTTSIEIDYEYMNISVNQELPNRIFRQKGYDKLIIKGYVFYGLTLPLYIVPLKAWSDTSNYKIQARAEKEKLGYLQCYPTVLACFYDLVYENAATFHIYYLHLIDTMFGPYETWQQYRPTIVNSNALSKTLQIETLNAECSIADYDRFKDLYQELLGSNFTIVSHNHLIN